jgi:ABC-type uncharacterized transport system permease subunit
MAPLELFAEAMLRTVAERPFKSDCSLGKLISLTRASGAGIARKLEVWRGWVSSSAESRDMVCFLSVC